MEQSGGGENRPPSPAPPDEVGPETPADEPGIDSFFSAAPDLGEAPAPTGGRHRHRFLPAGAAVLVVVGAVVGVSVSVGGPAVPGAGMTPAEFVVAATKTTLAHHTADVAVSGDISAAGTTVPLVGTGQADFTDGIFAVTITADTANRSLVERELVIGGHFYMGITIDGQDATSIVPGKHWIELPLPIGNNQGALGTGTVDPINQLNDLTKRGNSVRPLGTSVIDGATVSGYAVTPSQQTIDQGIQAEINTGKLSPAAQQQLRQARHLLPPFTFDVWFDASGLLHRLRVDFGSGGKIGGNVTMTLSHYGVPVNVSPPAPGDVSSFSDFIAAGQSAAAAHT